LNLAFVPFWGMLASAWATAGAYLFLTLRYLMVGQRLWRIEYDVRRTVIVTLVTVVLTAVAPALPDVSSAGTLLLKLAYVLAYVVALAGFGIFRRDDLDRARAALRRGAPEAPA
jgi:O-antigen/teichoic acid export membrane protein